MRIEEKTSQTLEQGAVQPCNHGANCISAKICYANYTKNVLKHPVCTAAFPALGCSACAGSTRQLTLGIPGPVSSGPVTCRRLTDSIDARIPDVPGCSRYFGSRLVTACWLFRHTPTHCVARWGSTITSRGSGRSGYVRT